MIDLKYDANCFLQSDVGKRLNMEITMMPIDELVPYENNPRINSNAVDAVAASIREFGFKVPIVIDSENVIIAGHTRLLAAKSIGMDEVPCIVANDLTEEQVKAFRLVDNKTAELAEWDMDALAAEMAYLEEFDWSDFGFDDMFENDDIDMDDLDLEDAKTDVIVTLKFNDQDAFRSLKSELDDIAKRGEAVIMFKMG